MLSRHSAISTDTLIRLKDLVDEDTGEYINDAVVTCTVVTAVGGAVLGQTWPLTLAYKAASNGVYRGDLQDTAIMPAGNYVARITAIKAGVQHYWEIPFTHLLDVGPRG